MSFNPFLIPKFRTLFPPTPTSYFASTFFYYTPSLCPLAPSFSLPRMLLLVLCLQLLMSFPFFSITYILFVVFLACLPPPAPPPLL